MRLNMPRDPVEVWKQLVGYADAAVAFGVVQSIAFIVGITNREFREAVLKLGSTWIAAL
jgi:hypothetical protein